MTFRTIYGNDWSENGWRMCEVDECENSPIVGTNVRIPLRQGPPTVVLKAFASRFNQLIEPLDQTQCGGWTPTNSVASSNHLAGTAMDLNWRRHEFRAVGTYGDKISILRQILLEFRGCVWYGGDWDNPKDEMHFQLNFGEGDQRIIDLANDLLKGYLGIYAPPDPNAFPLPTGWYYGPLDGPETSISGEFDGDLQSWKDGLTRWQGALGLPQTGKWGDGQTPNAAYTLQKEKGWSPNPDFGYGGVYAGEWDQVILKGWHLPGGWRASDFPLPQNSIVKWGDYSQYQGSYLTEAYPYEVVCFRSSVGDSTFNDSGSPTGKAGIDAKFVENMKRAKAMVASGKLKCVIAYHFWVPGADNIGAFKGAIQAAGGKFPELVAMIDVEDGGAKWNVTGDQSSGVNVWIREVKDYLNSDLKVAGYLNFNANNSLWLDIQDGLKMIVPRYNGPNNAPVTRAHINLFGHQYSSTEVTPPFGPSDINQSKMDIDHFLQAWGIGEDSVPAPEPQEPPVVVPGPPDVPPSDRVGILARAIRGEFDA